jgi:hypothetical protein
VTMNSVKELEARFRVSRSSASRAQAPWACRPERRSRAAELTAQRAAKGAI